MLCDPDGALAKYNAEKDALHAGKKPREDGSRRVAGADSPTLRLVINPNGPSLTGAKANDADWGR